MDSFFKEFQLQRLQDLETLSAVASQAWSNRSLPPLESIPESAQFTAAGTAILGVLLLLLLSRSGRRAVFLTVDTVLAVLLLGLLLAAVLALPIVAIYIGMRGSLLMARSLADNFPLAAALLRPLLVALGEAGPGAAAGGAATAGAQ
ncbi:hypothetical protein HYH02_014153 [Chlamydomonas schloesseri]|uniref:Uncharacterized protein n=1 Tax=Chlamydomonas schloesseri TaxID=2026947 RepID=A0A835VV73_9CHLO|nr:hypothetical protein HYH02_014153 [Chlamydomonas schloesseri]|eukprot:KAG2429115.1 hypothetical protein HYH02_014153 [Chlamydomonas schloesseri]